MLNTPFEYNVLFAVVFTVIGPQLVVDVSAVPINCPSRYKFTVVDATAPVSVPDIEAAPAATGPVIVPHRADEVALAAA